jgi:undecaprenyl-diphosphatase
MDTFQTIVLGMVQGLTEFIPVSSSGHLVVFQHFLFGQSDHHYLEFINIGTFLALVVFFRRRIAKIIKDIFEHKNYSLAKNIIITSVPAGLVGYSAADFIDSTPFFGSITTVIVALVVVGIVMIILEKLPHLSHQRDGGHLSWRRALVIGLVQVFALVPGVSRSGSTIIAGRLAGLNPAAAAEYSFLASLPIMLAVTVKLFLSSDGREYFVQHAPSLVLGNLVAFIAGMVAIKFLLNYLSNHSLAAFGWYRVGLASVLAVVLLLQWV